jgi:hypothetical protein
MNPDAKPPAAPWLVRAFHELQRRRHLVLHGNVDDLVRWKHRYVPLSQALKDFLAMLGFTVIGRYSLGDGLTFADERAHRLAWQAVNGGTPAPHSPYASTQASGSGSAWSDVDRTSSRTLRESLFQQRPPEARNATEALTMIRRLLGQPSAGCAVVIDLADLLLGPEGQSDEHYAANMAQLRLTLAEAREVTLGDGVALRNTLVFVSRDIGVLPIWLRESPHVAAVLAERPGPVERYDLLAEHAPRLQGAQELSDVDLKRSIEVLAAVTDGMTVRDIQAIEVTSRITGIGATAPRRLIARHRFGLRPDPWELLDIAKVRNAEPTLNERVMGQPTAVSAVVDVLVNARIGIDFVSGDADSSSRPKGVFFFVGPTGVGKTELAKAVAELVFEDESAVRRFDMSEYSQEHASERLTGAPPGFVGHEHGGVLTNWVRERPFSVILFDEIEKAHPKIFDKFLQIIDDGRLTDGQGQTVYFSHAIVIFTSNQGAATLQAGFSDGTPPYSHIQEHFSAAVQTLFTEDLHRPELLGRLGNGIVVFDVLREEVIERIAGKFLAQICDSARARGYELVLDLPAINRAIVGQLLRTGLSLGARPIRNPLLEKWVRVPLNRWILQNSPSPGTRIWVRDGEGAPPFTIEAHPDQTAS